MLFNVEKSVFCFSEKSAFYVLTSTTMLTFGTQFQIFYINALRGCCNYKSLQGRVAFSFFLTQHITLFLLMKYFWIM